MGWKDEASRCATQGTKDWRAEMMNREAFGPTNKING